MVFTICPTQLGWPVRRKRRYSVLTLRETCLRSFILPVELEGQGSLEFEVQGATMRGAQSASGGSEYVREQLAKKNMHTMDEDAERHARKALTPGQLSRVREVEQHMVSKEFIYDVNQTLDFTTADHNVPCLLRTSNLWSSRHQRLALPFEHMLMQGVPMTADLEAHKSDRSWAHFCRAHPALPDTFFKSLAGNAMRRSVCGTVGAYALSVLQPRLPASLWKSASVSCELLSSQESPPRNTRQSVFV